MRIIMFDAGRSSASALAEDGISAAKEILEFDSKAAIIFYTLLDIPNLKAKIEQIEVKRIVRKGDEDELLRVLDSIS